jgi:hypothetical protein
LPSLGVREGLRAAAPRSSRCRCAHSGRSAGAPPGSRHVVLKARADTSPRTCPCDLVRTTPLRSQSPTSRTRKARSALLHARSSGCSQPHALLVDRKGRIGPVRRAPEDAPRRLRTRVHFACAKGTTLPLRERTAWTLANDPRGAVRSVAHGGEVRRARHGGAPAVLECRFDVGACLRRSVHASQEHVRRRPGAAEQPALGPRRDALRGAALDGDGRGLRDGDLPRWLGHPREQGVGHRANARLPLPGRAERGGAPSVGLKRSGGIRAPRDGVNGS